MQSLEDEEILLNKIINKLDYGGILCVETRTIKDPKNILLSLTDCLCIKMMIPFL